MASIATTSNNDHNAERPREETSINSFKSWQPQSAYVIPHIATSSASDASRSHTFSWPPGPVDLSSSLSRQLQMPPKTRKRKSVDFVEDDKVDEPQSHLTPLNSNLERELLCSKSMKRQETLTQIGWIPSLRAGNDDDDLEYEEEPSHPSIKPINSRRNGKRRKLSQRETLTQMDFLSPNNPRDHESDHEGMCFRSPIVCIQRLPENGVTDSASSTGLEISRQPPDSMRKRPKMLKEKPLAREIQTRSVRRRAARQASTPICEDDTPIESPTVYPVPKHGKGQPQPSMPPPRTPQIRRTREVPSSQSPPDTPFSTHGRRCWGSQTRSPLQERSPNVRAAATPSSRRRLFPTKLEIADTMDSGEENSQTPIAAVAAKEGSHIYMPSSPQMPAAPHLNALKSGGQPHSPTTINGLESSAPSRQVKSEVLDSEDEGTDNSADENDFAAGAETQAACEVIASSSPSQFKEESQFVPVTVERSSTAVEREDQETEGLENGEEGNASLIIDYHPSPPRIAPETESQFENAWRSLSPPPHPSPFSSSPNHTSPNDLTTPTPASPFKHPHLPSQAAPIPPSQATTVDITQRTQPQLPLPLPRDLSSSTSKKSSRRIRSSSPSIPPPPRLPLSSSPLYSRKTPQEEVPWTGYGGGWDGKRLTDSQLLPDSLMNDTFAGPPGWDSQEIEYDGMEYEDV